MFSLEFSGPEVTIEVLSSRVKSLPDFHLFFNILNTVAVKVVEGIAYKT